MKSPYYAAASTIGNSHFARRNTRTEIQGPQPIPDFSQNSKVVIELAVGSRAGSRFLE